VRVEDGYILVVDDVEMNRDILTRRLNHCGHIVDQAAGGLQAMQLIEEKKYDLVLLDVMMPEISGLEVLRTAREKFSLVDLPIIMVTAKDQPEDIVEALKLGANDYVTKPINWPVVNARTQTQLQLRRLAQLKDEFLRIASHDLKNPLTCIQGFASLLEEDAKPGTTMTGELFDCLAKISKHSRVMARIIRDFLDFQALEAGKMKLSVEPVDLNLVARLAIERNETYAKQKDITLALEPEVNLPTVHADDARIGQVVDNLLGNAIKFTPKGGSATVNTRLKEDSIVLEVSDTGPGLTADDLTKLFVKYARLSNKPTGGEKSSGLGLSICKDLIEAHGGQIGARNNPEQGATFWFQIPVNPTPDS